MGTRHSFKPKLDSYFREQLNILFLFLLFLYSYHKHLQIFQSINYFYSQKKLLFRKKKRKRKVILNKHKEWRNVLIPHGNKQLNPNAGRYVSKMSDMVSLEIFRRTKVRGEPLEKLMKHNTKFCI